MVLTGKRNSAGSKPELNIKLVIEYDGKNYFGWQKQKNKPTIQGTIENSLHILFQDKKIKLTGAGRTDTGVHALNQTANFQLSKNAFENVGMKRFVHSINALLPADITVKNALRAKPGFHARYSAKKRKYSYRISLKKCSLNADKYFILKQKFDIDLAKEFCKLLEGVHSFRQFCKNKKDEHDFMSEIYFARVRKQTDGIILFEICANRFLHSMVRALVGMMVKIASSRISLDEFKRKFLKGEQFKIQYVPSYALILDKIIY
jgi:tRNA pseudouridine38-40 synthase